MRILPIAIVFSILGAHALAGERIDWRRGPDLPSARDHLGCGVVGGMFVVAGGAYWQDETKHFSAECIAYSPKTRKWTSLPSLPKGSAYGASGIYRDELLIAGGLDDTGALTQCLRLTKKGWKRLVDLPHPIAGAHGAVVGDKFIVIAGAPGFDEAGLKAAYRTMLELDLAHPKAWKERPLPSGFARGTGAATAAIGDTIYVFGGYGVQADGTLGNFGDAWSLRNGVWKRVSDMPAKVRWATAVALDSRYIGIFGGYGKDFLADAYLYDTLRDVYVKSSSLPAAVCNAAGGIIGDTVYLAGGEDKQRHRSAALVTGAKPRL